jgi:hypothetical protein
MESASHLLVAQARIISRRIESPTVFVEQAAHPESSPVTFCSIRPVLMFFRLGEMLADGNSQAHPGGPGRELFNTNIQKIFRKGAP